MKDFLRYYFKGLYLFLIDSNFRTLVRLFWLNIFKKRYKTYEVSFNGFKITVVDFKSFVFQYEEIFVNGFYEFKANVSVPVIYDCGANVGLSSLFFALKHPTARIVAYEASPSVFEVLRSNMKRNGIANVQLLRSAVWIKNDTLEFSEEGADSGSLYSLPNTRRIRVQAIDFLEVLNKEDRIDFIKVDIEGAETDLLPHIKSALHKIENLFIEYHSFNRSDQRLDEMLYLLRENKFRYYIRHGNDRKHPFINTSEMKDMDMQLNIFAYRL